MCIRYKLLEESKTIDHEIYVSAPKKFTQLKNIDSIRPGQWSFAEYEEEFFFGIILKVSCTGHVFNVWRSSMAYQNFKILRKDIFQLGLH